MTTRSQSMEAGKILLRNLKQNLPELKELLKEQSQHWTYEDPIYRYYHQSFKVYYLQNQTEAIVAKLEELNPWPEIPVEPFESKGSERHQEYCKERRSLNKRFREIVEDGTGRKFDLTHNQAWAENARPIVEAFFHAKFFLEMAVRYAEKLEEPPQLLPSGWATLLYLYNSR